MRLYIEKKLYCYLNCIATNDKKIYIRNILFEKISIKKYQFFLKYLQDVLREVAETEQLIRNNS